VGQAAMTISQWTTLAIVLTVSALIVLALVSLFD
jgi:hypothetical protein